MARPVGGHAVRSPDSQLPDGQATPEQFVDSYFQDRTAAERADALDFYHQEGLVVVGHRQWEMSDGEALDLLVLVFRDADGASDDVAGEHQWRDHAADQERINASSLPGVALYRDHTLGPNSNVVAAMTSVQRTEVLAYYYPPRNRPATSADLLTLQQWLLTELRLLQTQSPTDPGGGPTAQAGVVADVRSRDRGLPPDPRGLGPVAVSAASPGTPSPRAI